MSVIPKGWISCKLGEILYVKNGYAFRSTNYDKEGIPIIRISDIQSGKVSIKNTARIPKSKTNSNFCIDTGDLLIAMSGATTGKVGIYEHESLALQNQRVGNFKLYSEKYIDKRFRNYCVLNLRKQIEIAAYGGAQPNISSKNLENFEILLPPLNEQKRIVEKLDKLLAKVETAKTRLEKIPQLLKQFRQSVLSAAVSGELTKDWRQENPNAESGESIVIRILNEKKKYIKILKENDRTEQYNLPRIPNNWVWGTWDDYLNHSDNPFRRGPFGSSLKKEIFVSSGYKVYEQYCPINDDCSFARYYIDENKYKELKAFSVKANDFLISCSGVTLGRITRVPSDYEEGVINQALLRVRINENYILPNFFIHLFRSPFFQKNIFDNSTGSAIPNLKGVKLLKAIPVPIICLKEQEEIVKRVEALFKTADQIDSRYQKAKTHVDQLQQSILAKAFRGELVPQEPTDEPADVLLERIKREKNNKN